MSEVEQLVPLSAMQKQQEAPTLRMFISYASADRLIAQAVGEALRGALGEDFAEINFDKWFLEAGSEFEKQIKKKLQQTDFFIVVFTGAERESHGFTGWEVGYFARVMENRPTSKVVPLFLDRPPPTMSSVQGIGIGFNTDVLALDQKSFEAQNIVSDDDAMCAFISTLQQEVDRRRAIIGLRPAKLRDDQNPVECVRTMRQKIFRILRTKEEISFRPQKQVLFTTTDAAFVKSKPNLPPDAKLQPIASGSPMSIFGLPEAETTWENFLKSISESVYADSWRQAITSVVSSSFPDKINVDNSQVVVSIDEIKSYRIILTSCTKYYDDRREFCLCFVESLRRKDFGNDDTSMLLRGLDIVCRFRFMFLEPDSVFSGNSILSTRIEQLPDLAHSLVREIDLLGRDAKYAGLDRASTWSKFVAWPQLLRMAQDYEPRERIMRDIVGRILESQGQPQTLEKLRTELSDVVLDIESKTRPANTLLIRAMGTKLQELVADDA